MTQQTEAISAVWFLYSEANEPMGRLYRREGEGQPVVGATITSDELELGSAEIVEARELTPTCLMRRFRVTIRATS